MYLVFKPIALSFPFPLLGGLLHTNRAFCVRGFIKVIGSACESKHVVFFFLSVTLILRNTIAQALSVATLFSLTD